MTTGTNSSSGQPRRDFLKKSGMTITAGAIAAPFIAPSKGISQENSETLKVGLIGCGGRGTGAASQALSADNNVMLSAVGDVFEDRLDRSLKNLSAQKPEKVKVDPENKFIGFDAYKKVIDSGVDVVILTTPPGFRPMHLEYAIKQGKHVFCEKPMAVDGPGVRRVLAAAAEAKKKKLALVAGFCWRYNYGERAFMDKVHNGEIGDPMSLHTVYNTGSLWVHPRQPGWSDMLYQMRNWYYFAWLSGDHIMEQACHSVDKMSWAMKDELPTKCWAHGGRQVRTGNDYGHIYDHFSVVYEYANGAHGYHHCRQQAGCVNDNSDYFIGTKGIGRIKAFGNLTITGENRWRFRGERPNMYQVEHNELFASIRNGTPINDGVWMANSTLQSLMGRMAAYTGQTVTPEQALNSKQDLMKYALNHEDPDTDPVFDWGMDLQTPEVAMPGITKIL